MKFELSSPYTPTGDQPEAIAALSEGLKNGIPFQTLLGVTGSGKTFTIANVIERVQKPTLVLSHNKTLAAQLYSEFKTFFPNNAVEYFVSYYDYYQPEAYLPSTDTYIEKDLAINEEIDKLRLRATASLLSGRKDVIVVSSVSCLYGMADPTAFAEKVIHMEQGMRIDRDELLRKFVGAMYVNNKLDFNSGCFRVNGDTVDIFPAIETFDGVAYRIEFWGDEIDRISSFDPHSGQEIDEQSELNIYPTNLFVTTQERINQAIGQIDVDLGKQVEYFKEIGKLFVSEWEKEFGKAKYYLSDSFNEMKLPVEDGDTLAKHELLAQYGETIYSSIAAGNPDAVWVTQGWTFGYQHDFWDKASLAALLSRVPDDRMMIVDLANDYPKWVWHTEQTWKVHEGFYGKQWIYSYVPNFGGKVLPTGDLPMYASGSAEASKTPRGIPPGLLHIF